MMGIAQKVSRNFSDAVRSRGQSYFSKGRVSLMSAKPHEVVARVRGTTKYRVRVRLRGAKLLASCSCPYFSPQGEPCKHLWATLLLADSRGFLQSAPNLAIRLIPEPPRRTGPAGALPVSDLGSAPPDPNGERPMGMDMGGERLPGAPGRMPRHRVPGGRPARNRGLVGGPPPPEGTWTPGGPRDRRDRRAPGRGKLRAAPNQVAARAKPVN